MVKKNGFKFKGKRLVVLGFGFQFAFFSILFLVSFLIAFSAFGIYNKFSEGEIEGVGMSPERSNVKLISELEISKVRQQISEISNGLAQTDFSPLYSFLETKKGKYEEITQTCAKFESLFCLKKASQQNPNMREKICGDLKIKLKNEYSWMFSGAELNDFVEGHVKDCKAGIPQFNY